MDVQSYLIGHLGIVAGIFDALNIADVIDRVLPKRGSRNLPHSAIIKAMLLNGSGFTGQRLYWHEGNGQKEEIKPQKSEGK